VVDRPSRERRLDAADDTCPDVYSPARHTHHADCADNTDTADDNQEPDDVGGQPICADHVRYAVSAQQALEAFEAL
jgi:hypothetical protein